MKKSKPTFDGIEFDSNEEIEVYQWIQEAIKAGLIYGPSLSYQPAPFLLSPRQSRKEYKRLKTKIKLVDKFLLHPHEYTADFEFEVTSTGCGCRLPFEMCDDGPYVTIDVKGSFNAHGGDRGFAINQKWVYAEHGVFVNKVVPAKLFEKTWVPALARLTPKTKKIKAEYAKFLSVAEFLEKKH
tara:strand:- start:676 stop:1224 length:549 start_codon:yes stop_codon:yes gene_type:complete